MRCAFCEATVLDVEEAINAGWEPSYWTAAADGKEISEPVCPRCQSEHCDDDGHGLVLKPGHENVAADTRQRLAIIARVRATAHTLTTEQLRAIDQIIKA